MLNVAAALRTVFDDYVNGGRRHVSTLTLATCAEQVEAALREVDRARDYLLPVAGSCESVALIMAWTP